MQTNTALILFISALRKHKSVLCQQHAVTSSHTLGSSAMSHQETTRAPDLHNEVCKTWLQNWQKQEKTGKD